MTHLDWNAIYLTCFGVGLVLSIVGFFSGFLHFHLGHFHVGGHAGLHGTHGAGSPHAPGHGVGVRGAHTAAGVSPVNGFTLLAFLCWFGGVGFLLHRSGTLATPLVLLLATVSGLAGASLVFWFLARVLMAHERTLEPEDTELIGVVGRVSGAVPAGGVGEILYSQNGARRSLAVRSESGAPLVHGSEVIVMQFARGVGIVRPWMEFEHGLFGNEQGPLHQTGSRETAAPE